jgi:hypothetical protein
VFFSTSHFSLLTAHLFCCTFGVRCTFASWLFRPCIAAAWPCICASAPCKVLVAQVAGGERTVTKLSRCNRALERYAGKAGAIGKSANPNAGNAGYGYAGKAGATAKSPPINAGNAVRYGYAGKAGAIDKSANPNAGNAVPYG